MFIISLGFPPERHVVENSRGAFKSRGSDIAVFLARQTMLTNEIFQAFTRPRFLLQFRTVRAFQP